VIASVFLLALDQITKTLVRAYMEPYQSIPILGDVLRLTYVLNPGSAFGIRILGVQVLLIFGWTAAVLLTVYLFHISRRRDPMTLPVMLFLIGAAGNSIDRTFYGKVTDFIDADFPNIIMARWPVFNVADSCVTIGIILVFYLAVVERIVARRKRAARAASLPRPDDASPSNSLSNHNGSRSAASQD
jgi:signal peptidase II